MKGYVKVKDNSRYCIEEGKEALGMATAISRSHPKKEIVLLMYYWAQVEYFKILCQRQSQSGNFRCTTVDSFQGKESQVIILCTCAYEKKLRNFLSNKRRNNVALSRAKERLIVMGCLTTINQDDVWREIVGSFTEVTSDEKRKLL